MCGKRTFYFRAFLRNPTLKSLLLPIRDMGTTKLLFKGLKNGLFSFKGEGMESPTDVTMTGTASTRTKRIVRPKERGSLLTSQIFRIKSKLKHLSYAVIESVKYL